MESIHRTPQEIEFDNSYQSTPLPNKYRNLTVDTQALTSAQAVFNSMPQAPQAPRHKQILVKFINQPKRRHPPTPQNAPHNKDRPSKEKSIKLESK